MSSDPEPMTIERERLLDRIADRLGIAPETTAREVRDGVERDESSRTALDRDRLTERERALIDGLLGATLDDLRRLAAALERKGEACGLTAAETAAASGGEAGGSEPTLSFAVPVAGRASAEGPRAGGRFSVIRSHARGGLGQVSLASDAELRREVALKEILPDRADDPDSRARFLLEAEVTGRLEHPGVVPVYSLGTDARGRPFYAMRFIRGESLKEAIERFHDASLQPVPDAASRALALRGLLTRFVGVCEAVEYAHSRGVIHRDIKPANILLGPYGETLLVDWGLAKVTGWEDLDGPFRVGMPAGVEGDSNRTVPGSAVGTPSYMSPEQAAGRLDEIGPASDVYGLGASLYALLTGRAPVRGAVSEVIASVRDGRFPSPRAVNPQVPKALEAVVLKAMALQSGDRYPSARALGEDINRWLADEAVSAWREPWPTRLMRWLSRHRAGVTAAGAAGLVALAGLAVVLFVQARSNRRLASVNAALRTANDRSRERFTLALSAARQFLDDAAENPALNDSRLVSLRRELLGSSLEFYGKLQGALQGDPDPTTRADLAAADLGAARITAVTVSRQAALEPTRRAVAAYAALAAADPSRTAYHRGEADALRMLAGLQGQLGQIPQALEAARRALWIFEQLAVEQPETLALRMEQAEALNQIAQLLSLLDRRAEAVEASRRAVAIGEDIVGREPDDRRREALAEFLSRQSALFQSTQPDAAQDALQRAIALRRDLVSRDPEDLEARHRLAGSLLSLGTMVSTRGRHADAVVLFREALALREELRRAQPSRVDFHEELADLLLHYAAVEQALGHPDQAIELGGRARTAAAEVVAAGAEGVDSRTAMGFILHQLASNYAQAGDLVRARDTYGEALAIAEETLALAPQVARTQYSIALHLLQLGIVQVRLRELNDARATLQRGLEICEDLLANAPGTNEYVTIELHCLMHLIPLMAGDAPDAARAHLETARERVRTVARRVPEMDFDLACCEAGMVGAAGDDEAAERAMAGLRRAVAEGYRDLGWMRIAPALAPVRDRPEFQALLLDLAFPADPFAR